MTTRRNILIIGSLLPLAACGGAGELKTAAREVAHDVIVGAARDVAVIGEAFVKSVLPVIAKEGGAVLAQHAKGLLAEVAQSAFDMAQTKAKDVATAAMIKADSAVHGIIQLVKSRIPSALSLDNVMQAALSLLPVAKTALGMIVPPMAGAMHPDQARAVLRGAA